MLFKKYFTIITIAIYFIITFLVFFRSGGYVDTANVSGL